ncbi:RluA family pseudouridine synthase, partial [bacterium]|nr:RluA family pseudouridine synthase [bacterium]
MVNDEFFVIEADHAGVRIDKWLATIFNQFSRSHLTEQIKNGYVLLNDNTVNPSIKLKVGDNIRVKTDHLKIDEHLSDLIPQEGKLDIVIQHEHFIILNKAPGVVVHPGAGVRDQTLANYLVWHFPGNLQLPNWGLIHRLDKDTSGLMVIALTLEGYHELTKQMLAREIKRTYLALTMGHIRYGQTIETYMSRDPRNRLKRAVTTSPLAKRAITHVKVKERFEKMTLVECTLETGRTHQIRVHMEHIRHPIVGEPLYSGNMPTKRLFHRQALHATHLSFNNPWDKRLVEADALLPEDFTKLLDSLR